MPNTFNLEDYYKANAVTQNIQDKPLPERFRESLVVPELRVGAGNKGLVISKDGIYSGARKYEDAEFSLPLTGQFVYRSSLSQSTVSSLANGQQVINQVKVTNNAGKNLLPIVERVVYVGSRSAANILPAGSSIDESQWQIIGDIYSHVDTSGNDVGINEVCNWRYIRNISAGTVNLLIDVYVRYIVNQGG